MFLLFWRKYEIFRRRKSRALSQSEAGRAVVFRAAARMERKSDCLRLIIVSILANVMQVVVSIQESVSIPCTNDLINWLVPLQMLF